MKIAFSTVATPEMTMPEVAAGASRWGYQGVELRLAPAPDTVGSPRLACDPMSINADTLRRVFDDAGVVPMCLATGVRFDRPVWPPVLGRLFLSEEVGVAETKAAVVQAHEAGVPFVRVFGHQTQGGEPRGWSLRRIADRLALAAQTARNTRVRLLIENSGSFLRGEDLAALHARVRSPFLKMSYSVVAGVQGGDCPISEVERLRNHLAVVKVCDLGEDGRPVALGEGVLPIAGVIRALRDTGYTGWVVYEFPRLWRSDLAAGAPALGEVAERLYAWAGAPADASSGVMGRGHGRACAAAG